MTAEKLHDALNLLPGDLIAATDKLRTQPRKKVLHLRQWVSLAACLAVMIYGGWLISSGFDKSASTDAAMQMEGAVETYAAAAEDAAPAEGSAETRATVSGDSKDAPAEAEAKEEGLCELPIAADAAAQSVETPQNQDSTACYLSTPRIRVLRSRTELEDYFTYYAYRYDFTVLEARCTAYDDGWFESHDLLLIALHAVPVDQTCEVTSITEENGTWYVCIADYRNHIATADICTDWHLLIETEKDQIPSNDSIQLIFE